MALETRDVRIDSARWGSQSFYRLTHLPTGIVVSGDSKDAAWRELDRQVNQKKTNKDE